MVRLASMFAVLACAFGAPAMADPPVGDPAQGWEVISAGQACQMISTFEDDVTIGLVWTPKAGNLSFLAFGDNWKKVAGKPGSKVPVNLKFDGKVPHDDWTDEAAHVVSLGTNRTAVIADWGPEMAKELASTVSGSGTVKLSVGGKPIGTYNIDGSPAAYEQLMHCGSELASK
jgi:hypothetical protein